LVGCKKVGRAVVEPVVAIQRESHLKKAIMAIETDKTWAAILESGYCPHEAKMSLDAARMAWGEIIVLAALAQ
jgi:hypothetical protein